MPPPSLLSDHAALGRVSQRQALRGDLAVAGPTLLLAAVVGWLSGEPQLAVAVAVLPFVLWSLTRRRLLMVALALALPFPQDITGGRLGVHLALSDLLLVLLLASFAVDLAIGHERLQVRVPRLVQLALSQHLAVLGVLLVVHLSLSSLLATAQRIELFVLPVVAGVLIAHAQATVVCLRAYVIGSAVLAVLWPLFLDTDTLLAIQKNPAGQFMANALLIVVAVKPVRDRLVLLLVPVLMFGLLLTQSRGAIVSVPVGLAVVLLLQSGRSRVRSAAVLAPLAAVAYALFRLLPQEAQERNTSFSSGTGTRAEYALKIREQYRADAWDVIHAQPWSGVGVGRYSTGSPLDGTITDDPHQVLLLQAAEGGYALAGSFLLLIAGSAAALARLARRSEVAVGAAAVLLATAFHGLVDVYWVRGTPLLGWLMLGLALAEGARDHSRR